MSLQRGLFVIRVLLTIDAQFDMFAFACCCVRKRWVFMALLADLQPGTLVRGLLPGNMVASILTVVPHSGVGAEVVYKDADGAFGSELLYQDTIEKLQIVTRELSWGFDADGALFRLASEAYRIRLAYLFDPLLAVHICYFLAYAALDDGQCVRSSCPCSRSRSVLYRDKFGTVFSATD